ncbi:hypothetical protein N7478_006955 [Penicillium angulare]|uniref:uncharacterized protein n=1 Tax=Penicillium angulare TaxID=116970 RepID=UPI002540A963|nr:uncharacterized protein N7478_006955 [Penicillium angulare]KAJ5281583.1 hypothetical protein N7478_006955 [Penicillium angulare]
MDYSTTYAIAAAIALTIEYSQHILKYNLDIRVECLCWIFLYVAIKLHHKFIRQPTAALDNGILSQDQIYAFNWITWSTSICIAGARVLMVHHDTVLAMNFTIAYFAEARRP